MSCRPPVEPVEAATPLFTTKGDATVEEVAALVLVLHAVSVAPVGEAARRPRSEWSAPHRTLRGPLVSGPGGWRASTLPR